MRRRSCALQATPCFQCLFVCATTIVRARPRARVYMRLQASFRIPPWHTHLLASRLIHMLRTDLEAGLLERTVSAVQWRHQAIMER